MCKRPPARRLLHTPRHTQAGGRQAWNAARPLNPWMKSSNFFLFNRGYLPTYHPEPCMLNFLFHISRENAAGSVLWLQKSRGHIASVQRPSDGPALTCCFNKANHSEEWSQPLLILRLPSLFRFRRVSGWFPDRLFHWVTVGGTGMFSPCDGLVSLINT